MGWDVAVFTQDEGRTQPQGGREQKGVKKRGSRLPNLEKLTTPRVYRSTEANPGKSKKKQPVKENSG